MIPPPTEHEQPAPLTATSLESSVVEPAAATAAPRVLIASAIVGLLVLGVAMVFWELPHRIAPPTESTTTSTPPRVTPTPTATAPTPLIPEPPDARRTAQDALAKVLTLRDALRTQGAGQWAANDFTAMTNTVAAGEQAYREQRYSAASRAYAEAAKQGVAMRARRPEIIAEYLDQGEHALLSQDARAASSAYSQALNLDPNNLDAAHGLARAESFDKVVALLTQAEGYERLHDTPNATRTYREVLKLDSQAAAARQALARIASAEVEMQFSEAMSRGFKALEGQDYSAAKAFFVAALNLNPNSREATHALAQTTSRATAARLESALHAAQRAVAAENWPAAAVQFRAALALDGAVSEATAGLANAERRAALETRLAATLRAADQLTDDAAYAAAQALLREATAVHPSPRLSRAIAALKAALVAAHATIKVTLQSDGITEVTLQRVGPLGAFTEHALALRPGRYTALGTRRGYRDARVEFTVAATAVPIINIQCREAVAFGR